MDGTGELFAPLLPFLEPDFACTVVQYPDRRANYAQHVEVARRELPKDRPFLLLGESFSGPVAVSIAASAPPNLVGLVLCATFVTCLSSLLRLFRPLTAFASPKLVPAFLAQRMLLGRSGTAPLRFALEQALSHVSSPTLTARLRAMSELDAREQMRDVARPVLYLRARDDRLVPASAGDEILALTRDAELATVGGPHMLLQTQPAECAARIRDFQRRIRLADITGGPAPDIAPLT
jgi:pimeloyl-ACP methyl ester carboxylesterase